MRLNSKIVRQKIKKKVAAEKSVAARISWCAATSPPPPFLEQNPSYGWQRGIAARMRAIIRSVTRHQWLVRSELRWGMQLLTS